MQVLVDTTEASPTMHMPPPPSASPTTAPPAAPAPLQAYRMHYPAPEPSPKASRRRRLIPWSPFWHWAKMAARSVTTLMAFLGIIFAPMAGRGGPPYGLPPSLVGLLYDAAEWSMLFRNLRSRRGMHPFVTFIGEAVLTILYIVFLVLYLDEMLDGWEMRWFTKGARGALTAFLLVAIVGRIVLLMRASLEAWQRRAVADVCQYFHDPDTDEPPVRVMVTDLYGFDGPTGHEAERNIKYSPPGFWDGDDQGSTKKVFVPVEPRS
ncbi:hypothetical protein ACHAQH_008220 [Verticillium albo-atrum]